MSGPTNNEAEKLERDVLEMRRRDGISEQVWDRIRGEPTNQFEAFEVYRQIPPWERSIAEAKRRLNLRGNTIYSWARRNHWRARAQAWDDHKSRTEQQAALSAIRQSAHAHVSSLSYVQAIANMHLERVHADLTARLQEDPSHIPDWLNPRDLINWVKIAQERELIARDRLADAGYTGRMVDELDMGTSSLQDWRTRYVEPDKGFLPHPKQLAFIRDDRRFCTAVAGIQGGKSTSGAIAAWKRILEDRYTLHPRGERGHYWLVAPNSIVGETMCEVFATMAPPGEIVETKGGSGAKSGKTWVLSDGARVQFRSAEKADTLVARTLHGAWLDEFTLMKPDVWRAGIRNRVSATDGWALFTGTPRGRNWAYEEIWRRGDPDDDAYDHKHRQYSNHTWHSEENPRISPEEVALAKEQLPKAYFEREWRASWESFHGQIYEHWVDKECSRRGLASLRIPADARAFMGIDWGLANPGAVVVGIQLPGPGPEFHRWRIVEEVYAAEQDIDWWEERIASLWKKWKVQAIHCDPEDPARILRLVKQGMPAKKARNRLFPGIYTVSKAIKTRRMLVDVGCKMVRQQLASYHWEETRHGRQEKPAKGNDHAADAVRYMLHSVASDPGPPQRITYGGRR